MPLLTVAAGLLALSNGAADRTFTVGTARAERGHTATGFIEVPAGVDAATSIPVAVIVSTDRPKDPSASRYLENTATTRLKPSITAEAGHAGTVEAARRSSRPRRRWRARCSTSAACPA